MMLTQSVGCRYAVAAYQQAHWRLSALLLTVALQLARWRLLALLRAVPLQRQPVGQQVL